MTHITSRIEPIARCYFARRLRPWLGSAYEARQGLRIAVAWRYLTAAQAAAMIAALDRLAGRLYGLLRK